jgi:hypothetical protein
MSGWETVGKNGKKPKAQRRSKKLKDEAEKEVKEAAPAETFASIDDAFTAIADMEVTDYLKVGIYGEPGSGKSHFAATFPEPIYVIDTENRFARLGRKFPGKDIRVMHCYAEDKDGIFDPVATLHKMEQAISQIRKMSKEKTSSVGTIVLDSTSDVWQYSMEYMKIEHLTKDRFALVNREGWNWGIANKRNDAVVLKSIVQDAHVVLTGKIAYDDSGSTRGTWRKEVPYFVDVIIVVQCVDSDDDEEPSYFYTIEKCAENGRLQTQTHEDLTYSNLYNMIYPTLIDEAEDGAAISETEEEKPRKQKSKRKNKKVTKDEEE